MNTMVSNMKNVQTIHNELLKKAKAIAAKHNCFAVLPSTAKHTSVDYTAKIKFIEKNEINKNWTDIEALYADNATTVSAPRIGRWIGKEITLNTKKYVIIGLKTTRSDSKVVLRNSNNQLVLVDNDTSLDVALLTVK